MVIRVRVWCLPPGRAGRAPQASRHNRTPDVDPGVGEAVVAGGGLGATLRLGLLTAVVAGMELGLTLGEALGFVAVQPPTMAARPVPPANWITRRRLTRSGSSSGGSGGDAAMAVTIRSRLRSGAGRLFGLRDCLTERGILIRL